MPDRVDPPDVLWRLEGMPPLLRTGVLQRGGGWAMIPSVASLHHIKSPCDHQEFAARMISLTSQDPAPARRARSRRREMNQPGIGEARGSGRDHDRRTDADAGDDDDGDAAELVHPVVPLLQRAGNTCPRPAEHHATPVMRRDRLLHPGPRFRQTEAEVAGNPSMWPMLGTASSTTSNKARFTPPRGRGPPSPRRSATPSSVISHPPSGPAPHRGAPLVQLPEIVCHQRPDGASDPHPSP